MEKEGLKEATFCCPKSSIFRLDVGPWILIYSILLYATYYSNNISLSSSQLSATNWTPSLFENDTNAPIFIPTWILLTYPVFLLLHVLVHLSSNWSVKWNVFVAYHCVKTMNEATHVLVIPLAASKDKPALLPLHKYFFLGGELTVLSQKFTIPYCTFSYQKILYCYYQDSDNSQDVKRLKYPIYSKLSILNENERKGTALGYQNGDDVNTATVIWGKNTFDIPVPSFWSLLGEHMIAPFFLFQMLCLVLWSLDDYWYYAIFTFFMLTVFEASMVKQRQGSFEMLRSMRRPPYIVFVYRYKRWIRCSTESLLPGDIVSLGSMTNISQETMMTTTNERGGGDSEKMVPCDIFLLSGSCIVNEAMLTGESTPSRKEALNLADPEHSNLSLQDGLGAGDNPLRLQIVMGGTKVVQTLKPAENNYGNVPDQGAVGIVLRTGFETSQGQLMRTILYASERLTGQNLETLLFIGVLLFFAIIASTYVLREGMKDNTKNKFKLFLHCVMIVTSVVPPELPLELSLAVTHSLGALAQKLVYCTEPYRIPLAGKVSACCFDKTGTLTTDDLLLNGILEYSEAEGTISDLPSVPREVRGPPIWVLSGCHSLLTIDGETVGDPLEKATLEGIQWKVLDGDQVQSLENPQEGVQILKRFPFSSSLKRMSTITIHSNNQKVIRVLSKGAPEVLENLLCQVPPSYRQTYLQYMSSGKRVLALAYKEIKIVNGNTWKEVANKRRGEIEKDFCFGGFIVLDSPLKSGVSEVIGEINKSAHITKMITGDASLTAIDVAKKTQIIPETHRVFHLIHDERETGRGKEFYWEEIITITNSKGEENTYTELFDHTSMNELAQNKKTAFCIEGKVLKALMEMESKASNNENKSKITHRTASNDQNYKQNEQKLNKTNKEISSQGKAADSSLSILESICLHVQVFARVSPDQKEFIILSLKNIGITTLMCGDGTNDVGALKVADVGVSIINNPVVEKEQMTFESLLRNLNSTSLSNEERQQQLQELERHIKKQESNPTIVQLGDASIASAFTSKNTSIECVLSILKQGRCTQISTIQVYKILAVNCLISAYQMSFLYLYGVKLGDTQMTVVGFVVSMLFFLNSRATPLPELSIQRPPQRIFCSQVCLSIFMQFLIHFSALYCTIQLSVPYVNFKDPSMSPDSIFRPNIINSAIFLITTLMQLNTFVTNYRGHPFTISLFENTPLFVLTIAAYTVIVVLLTEAFPVLNKFLQLAPFPQDLHFQQSLSQILLYDTIAILLFERIILRLTT